MWKKIKGLFSKAQVEEEDTPMLFVWGVIEGPFTLHGELSDDEEDTPYYNLCKVSITGEAEMFNTEIYFDSFDSAYKMKRYFDSNVKPLTFPLEDVT